MSFGKKFLICPILPPMTDLTPFYGTSLCLRSFDSWGTNTLVCLRSFDSLGTNKFVFVRPFDTWGLNVLLFLCSFDGWGTNTLVCLLSFDSLGWINRFVQGEPNFETCESDNSPKPYSRLTIPPPPPISHICLWTRQYKTYIYDS